MEPGIDTTDDTRRDALLTPVQRRYRLLPQPTMPAPGTVLHRGLLEECDLLAQAQEAARNERALLLSETQVQAQANARLIEEQTQSATLQQAAQLLQQMERAREAFFQQAEELLLRIVRDSLGRLLADVPAQCQDRSSVRLLVREFRDTAAHLPAQLHVRSDAIQDLRLPELSAAPWPALELVADDSLTTGQCLLRCAHGDLRADYLASVNALVEALRTTPPQLTENALASERHEDTRHH